VTTDVRTQQHRHPEAAARFARLPEAEPETVAAVLQVLALADHDDDNGPGADADLAHHTVNTVVRRADASTVRAWSRRLAVSGTGAVTTSDVLDVLEPGAGGWVLTERVELPRHGGPATEVAW
jgi:hypothetical protein